ncbi:MAG: TonB-dependent receptor [Gemmatimonadota bacterium]|nr:TonB-dependent receptor [Gemmatimonadota bacterium]
MLRCALVLSLLVAGALVGAPRPAAAQDDAGAITGTITDSATGAPVEAATVYLKGALLRATTNARGEFRLFPVSRGPQTVVAVMIGYRAANAQATVPASGTVAVTMMMVQTSVELPGLVVTASRGAQEQRESPVSISVVSNAELIDRNVPSVKEALEFVPGVSFNNKDMAIRGSSGVAEGVGSRVLVLLDGHPVLSPNGAQLNFEFIPLLDTERVEVVKGAYSALYGSNALGGVVNMLTAPIAEEPATVLRARLGVYQTPEQYQFTDEGMPVGGIGVQHSRPVGSVGVRLFAGYEGTTGYTDNDQATRWVLRGKATSRPGSQHPWDAFVIFMDEAYDEYFTWYSEDRPFEVDSASRGDRTHGTTFLTGGTVTPLVRARSVLQVSPYLHYTKNRNDFQANQNYHDAVKAGTSAQLGVTWSEKQMFSVGVDGAYTHTTSNFLGGRNVGDAAAFGQYEFRPLSRLKVVAGLRFDFHQAETAEGEVAASPKLGVVINTGERFNVRASIGRGYRAPSVIEQFVQTTQYGFAVIPNPDLIGERAWATEVGVTGSRGRFWLDASVFLSDYDDLIAPAPAGPFVFQFQNVDQARVAGFDASVRMQVFRDFLDATASYMYLDSEDLDTGKPLPYRSRHSFTGTLNAFEGRVGMDFRFKTAPEEVIRFPFDPRYDMTVFDLRLSQELLGATFQLKVENLFQDFYTEQERHAGPPRSLHLTVLHGI